MNVLESLISLIAPHQCLVCGVNGTVLCHACLNDSCERLPSRCFKCFKLTSDFAVCPRCHKATAVTNVWVRTSYGGVSKQLTQSLKYERLRAAHRPIADLMLEAIPYFSEDVLVSHVPTATSRHRQRGYDQAELLARRIAKARKLEYQCLLRRTGQTRQVGSSRETRMKQLAEAYSVRSEKKIKARPILLVDDITTTGASLNAAARALKASGAKKVYAAVFAQKQ